jgi:hypothetical protein
VRRRSSQLFGLKRSSGAPRGADVSVRKNSACEGKGASGITMQALYLRTATSGASRERRRETSSASSGAGGCCRHVSGTVLRGADALARARASHTPGEPSPRSAPLPRAREWLFMLPLPGCWRL